MRRDEVRRGGDYYYEIRVKYFLLGVELENREDWLDLSVGSLDRLHKELSQVEAEAKTQYGPSCSVQFLLRKSFEKTDSRGVRHKPIYSWSPLTMPVY